MNAAESFPPPSSPSQGVVSAFVIRHVMALGDRMGVGRGPLMDRARVTEADMEPADGWVRQDVLERLLLCSLDHWRDPVVTLRVVLAMEPAMMGVVGYLMQCCPTLLDMQQAVTEFGNLVSTLHKPFLIHEPGAALWGVHVDSQEAGFARNSIEGYLALCALLIRRQLPEALLAVRFSHAPVLLDGEIHPLYDKAFGCPVLFGQPLSALVLRPQSLNRPLPLGDPVIFETLRGQAQALLRRTVTEPSLATRVKDHLRQMLAHGDTSREAVAERLGMSARHLGRQLQAQGSHFQAILDELRAELAHQYLLQAGCDLEAVAAKLGFSGASAFSRWFRATLGVSPLEFRRDLRARG